MLNNCPLVPAASIALDLCLWLAACLAALLVAVLLLRGVRFRAENLPFWLAGFTWQPPAMFDYVAGPMFVAMLAAVLLPLVLPTLFAYRLYQVSNR